MKIKLCDVYEAWSDNRNFKLGKPKQDKKKGLYLDDVTYHTSFENVLRAWYKKKQLDSDVKSVKELYDLTQSLKKTIDEIGEKLGYETGRKATAA